MRMEQDFAQIAVAICSMQSKIQKNLVAIKLKTQMKATYRRMDGKM